jgi:MFS family permease
LVLLAIFMRAMLTGEPSQERVSERSEFGFLRFFFSKRVFLYMFMLLMPFVLGEYFIEQFSPLYADTIELSPGAASWTSLLMTMTLAYIAPAIVRPLIGRISSTAICVFANAISAAGLIWFALSPGLVTLYAASGLLGISIGVGKNIIAARYSELAETGKYRHSGYVYNLFDSLFGLAGAALFTLVFILGAENLFAIAAFVVGAALLYQILQRRVRG